MGLPVGNHREEASSRVPVLIVFLQVLRELVDARGEYCDLDFWRTSVCGVYCGTLDNFLFLYR